MIDINNIPKEIADQILITQSAENIILDPDMVLMEFFGTRKLDGSNVWQIIKSYNTFVFSQKVSPLKLKAIHLKEANEYLTEELEYMSICNADFITELKNHHVDVPLIMRSCREKVNQKANARKQMEEDKAIAKITRNL